jgi:DNA polymerase III alpha subunit
MLDNKGNMFVEEDDIIELMLQNRQAKILPRDVGSFKLFDSTCKTYGIENPFILGEPVGDQLEWTIPEPWSSMDVYQFLLDKVGDDKTKLARIELELVEFAKRDLVDLLRFLIYFAHMLRQNNIIYGVGRGSSVASYVLFLIGIHRIDSLKYNMDIKEFLK